VRKELIAQRIMDHIIKNLVSKEAPPIILQWKQDLIDSGQKKVVAQIKSNIFMNIRKENKATREQEVKIVYGQQTQ
jgi:hypothetical protein